MARASSTYLESCVAQTVSIIITRGGSDLHRLEHGSADGGAPLDDKALVGVGALAAVERRQYLEIIYF